MSAVFISALLLPFLMIIFGDKRGSTSYLTLLLSFVILTINIVSVILDVPIHVVTFFFRIIIGACNLFVLNSYNAKTQATLINTIATTILLTTLIYLSVYFGHLQGFSAERQDETYVYLMNIGIDMVQFMVFITILAVIAAMIDLIVTIDSPIHGLHQVDPTLTRYGLFQSGMHVGREILVTSANTIYLAFLGGQLALFIQFFRSKYSSGHIINSKIFAQEFISTILGGIAVTIDIPITVWTAIFLIKRPSRQRKNDRSIN